MLLLWDLFRTECPTVALPPQANPPSSNVVIPDGEPFHSPKRLVVDLVLVGLLALHPGLFVFWGWFSFFCHFFEIAA